VGVEVVVGVNVGLADFGEASTVSSAEPLSRAVGLGVGVVVGVGVGVAVLVGVGVSVEVRVGVDVGVLVGVNVGVAVGVGVDVGVLVKVGVGVEVPRTAGRAESRQPNAIAEIAKARVRALIIKNQVSCGLLSVSGKAPTSAE
jgi:hypothetical protein